MRALMYHFIGSGRYGIEENLFDVHCALIETYPPDSVELTIDDGHASSLRMADILEKRNLRGRFFVVTDHLNKKGFLGSTEVRELYDRGHFIGTHGHQHKFFTQLSDQELESQLRRSQSELEQLIGSKIDHVSCPGGRFNQRVLKLLAKIDFSCLWTSEPASWTQEMPLLRRGRDCVLSHFSSDKVKSLLENRWPIVRTFRYRLLEGLKIAFGDKLYHAITTNEKDFN